jgi:hypothetical protein
MAVLAAILVSASMALIAVGLAAPASADPVPNVQQFFAAVQARGINGLAPAVLANGYNVCWQLWQGGYTGLQAAAGLQKTYPTLTTDQAAHFVIDAYQDLCPVPGVYDWWTYGTGGAGGGAAAAG